MKKGSFGSPGARATAFGSFSLNSQNGSPSAFGGVLEEQSSRARERDNGKKRELDHAIDAVEVKEAQVKVTRECNYFVLR